MKTMLSVLLVALAVTVNLGMACAAESPVAVTHKVTGYTQQGRVATTEYSLHVVNIGGATLQEVSLALVPQPPRIMERTSVNVGTLAPGQSADLQLQVKSASKQGDKKLHPLWWQGKALDAAGAAIQFPVKSRGEASHD